MEWECKKDGIFEMETGERCPICGAVMEPLPDPVISAEQLTEVAAQAAAAITRTIVSDALATKKGGAK